MATGRTGPAPPAAGAVDSIRLFLANWIAILKTRVEIVSTEIEEQREWLQHIIILAVAALFCVSLGLILLTLFVVVLFWESARFWVLGGFAVLYSGGGLFLVALLRQRIKSKPRFMATTAQELGKDYSSLQPRSTS